MLIVILFGFLNIKSVKIYDIPYIFATTLLLYKLDTLLSKQKNLPVLDTTGFFFRIRTQVTALVLRTSAFNWVLMWEKKPIIYIHTKAVTWVRMRKKKLVISNTGRFFCFNSTVSYTYWHSKVLSLHWHIKNFVKDVYPTLSKFFDGISKIWVEILCKQ